MKRNSNSRMIICTAIIITSLLCISCKYVDDSFLPKKEVATDSINKSGDLSQSKNLGIESMDSLTAIFDENGNIISTENDSIALLNDEKLEKNNIDAAAVGSKNNSSNEKAVSNKDLNSTNAAVATKTETRIVKAVANTSKNSATVKVEVSKKAKQNAAKAKIKTTTNNSKETDAERDYRLQKSNHSIPDL